MSKYIGTKAVNLSTTSADVTGNADIDGNLTVGGNLTVSGTTITVDHATAQTVDLGDNDKIRLGADYELQLWSDGTTGQISGDINHTGSITTDGLTVDGSASFTSTFFLERNNPNIRLDDSDSSNNAEITLDNTTLRIEVDEDNAVADSAIKFQVDGSLKAIIDADGNFGVGINTPTADLHLGGTNPNIVFGTSGNELTYLQRYNDDFYVYNKETAGNILLGTANQERMRVTDGGDVSIGSDHSGFSGWRTLNIRGQSTGGLLNFENNDGTRAFAFASQGSLMRYQAQLTGGAHKFETNAKSSGAFIITDSGDVGIGAMSPTANLSIDAGSATGTHLDITTTGSGHNFDMTDASSTARIRNVSGVLRIGADHNNEAADSYVRIDVDNTERLRITPDGIKFNGDTAAANALNDYEEGTFTPVLSGYTGVTGTFSGKYTKIGDMVFCEVYINITALTYSGNSRITGWPFTPSGTINNHPGHGTIGTGSALNVDAHLYHMGFYAQTGNLYLYNKNGGWALSGNNYQVGTLGIKVAYKAA